MVCMPAGAGVTQPGTPSAILLVAWRLDHASYNFSTIAWQILCVCCSKAMLSCDLPQGRRKPDASMAMHWELTGFGDASTTPHTSCIGM